MIRSNRVLIDPRVKSVLVVQHIKLFNLEATVPFPHGSNQASYSMKLSYYTLFFAVDRWKFIVLVQIPYNSKISRLLFAVGETAGKDDA